MTPLIAQNAISGALGLFTTVQLVIERAVILTRGAELALDAGILDPAPSGQPGPPPIETLEAAERAHILKALEACGWQVSGKAGPRSCSGSDPPPSTSASRNTGSTARAERSDGSGRSQHIGALSIC